MSLFKTDFAARKGSVSESVECGTALGKTRLSGRFSSACDFPGMPLSRRACFARQFSREIDGPRGAAPWRWKDLRRRRQNASAFLGPTPDRSKRNSKLGTSRLKTDRENSNFPQTDFGNQGKVVGKIGGRFAIRSAKAGIYSPPIVPRGAAFCGPKRRRRPTTFRPGRGFAVGSSVLGGSVLGGSVVGGSVVGGSRLEANRRRIMIVGLNRRGSVDRRASANRRGSVNRRALETIDGRLVPVLRAICIHPPQLRSWVGSGFSRSS